MINDGTQHLLDQHLLWAESLGRDGQQLSAADIDLHGADLSDLNLNEAGIPGADLSNAKLLHTDFAYTNLASARFAGADIISATGLDVAAKEVVPGQS